MSLSRRLVLGVSVVLLIFAIDPHSAHGIFPQPIELMLLQLTGFFFQASECPTHVLCCAVLCCAVLRLRSSDLQGCV
jgi:hypothetical protein